MNASQQMIKVPFRGDVLEAIQADDGKILVSPKRICQSLGIDWASQYVKLRDAYWACIVIITTHDETGRLQELVMIDHESIPIWMTHINPRKVKPEARQKIELFQREAKAVLSAWFLGTSADRPDIAAVIGDLRKRLASVEGHLRQSISRKFDLAALNEELRIKVDRLALGAATLGNCDPNAYLTRRDYFEEFGLPTPSHGEKIKASLALAKLSRELGIPIRKVKCSRYGEINSYRIDTWNTWRFDRDKRERLDALEFQRQIDELESPR